jgi:hypothetical protein
MREPAPFSFGALNPTPPERIETPEASAGDAGTGEGRSANPVSQRAGARTADRSAVGDTALRQSDPPSVRAVHADDAAPERLTDGDDAVRTLGASDAAEAVRHDEGPTGTPPAPARQVANAILKAAPFAEAASTSPDTGGLARRTAQPVSYLHIVLEPPGLGSVSVRLHVSDRRLHVEMQATEPRTRALIEADAAIIAGSLAEGGYDIERIAVMAAPGDPSSPSQSQGAGTPGTGQGASDRAFQSGSSDQGRQERPREQALHNQGSRTHHDGAADHRLSHRSADGLYV